MSTTEKSNILTVTTYYPNEITVNRLSVDSTRKPVGSPFHFTDHVEGYVDVRHRVHISLYINDRYTRGWYIDIPPGRFSRDFRFSQAFSEVGSYRVYTIASVVTKPGPPPSPPPRPRPMGYSTEMKSNVVEVGVEIPKVEYWQYLVSAIPIVVVSGVIGYNEMMRGGK